MKKKAIPKFWRFLLCIFISSFIGWLSTLLIIPATPLAESLTSTIIKNPNYHPMTIYILLALIPLTISVVTGHFSARIFRPKEQRV